MIFSAIGASNHKTHEKRGAHKGTEDGIRGVALFIIKQKTPSFSSWSGCIARMGRNSRFRRPGFSRRRAAIARVRRSPGFHY